MSKIHDKTLESITIKMQEIVSNNNEWWDPSDEVAAKDLFWKMVFKNLSQGEKAYVKRNPVILREALVGKVKIPNALAVEIAREFLLQWEIL